MVAKRRWWRRRGRLSQAGAAALERLGRPTSRAACWCCCSRAHLCQSGVAWKRRPNGQRALGTVCSGLSGRSARARQVKRAETGAGQALLVSVRPLGDRFSLLGRGERAGRGISGRQLRSTGHCERKRARQADERRSISSGQLTFVPSRRVFCADNFRHFARGCKQASFVLCGAAYFARARAEEVRSARATESCQRSENGASGQRSGRCCCRCGLGLAQKINRLERINKAARGLLDFFCLKSPIALLCSSLAGLQLVRCSLARSLGAANSNPFN